MAGEIHLWLREDGELPKAVAAGAAPPGPGPVVAVRARTADLARALLGQRRVLLAERLGLAEGQEPSAAQLEAVRTWAPADRELVQAVRVVVGFQRAYGQGEDA